MSYPLNRTSVLCTNDTTNTSSPGTTHMLAHFLYNYAHRPHPHNHSDMDETGPNSYLVHCVVSKTIHEFITQLQEIDSCVTQRDWRSIDLPDTPCILSLLSHFYNLEVITRHTTEHQKWKHGHDRLHNLVHPPRTTLVLSP